MSFEGGKAKEKKGKQFYLIIQGKSKNLYSVFLLWISFCMKNRGYYE